MATLGVRVADRDPGCRRNTECSPVRIRNAETRVRCDWVILIHFDAPPLATHREPTRPSIPASFAAALTSRRSSGVSRTSSLFDLRSAAFFGGLPSFFAMAKPDLRSYPLCSAMIAACTALLGESIGGTCNTARNRRPPESASWAHA